MKDALKSIAVGFAAIVAGLAAVIACIWSVAVLVKSSEQIETVFHVAAFIAVLT